MHRGFSWLDSGIISGSAQGTMWDSGDRPGLTMHAYLMYYGYNPDTCLSFTRHTPPPSPRNPAQLVNSAWIYYHWKPTGRLCRVYKVLEYEPGMWGPKVDPHVCMVLLSTIRCGSSALSVQDNCTECTGGGPRTQDCFRYQSPTPKKNKLDWTMWFFFF